MLDIEPLPSINKDAKPPTISFHPLWDLGFISFSKQYIPLLRGMWSTWQALGGTFGRWCMHYFKGVEMITSTPGIPWIFPNVIPWEEKTCWRKHGPDQDLTQVSKVHDRAMRVCGSQVLYGRCVSGELKHLPRSLNLQLQSCPDWAPAPSHFTACHTPQCLKLFHIISSAVHTICSLWGQQFHCMILGTPHLSGDIWGDEDSIGFKWTPLGLQAQVNLCDKIVQPVSVTETESGLIVDDVSD